MNADVFEIVFRRPDGSDEILATIDTDAQTFAIVADITKPTKSAAFRRKVIEHVMPLLPRIAQSQWHEFFERGES